MVNVPAQTATATALGLGPSVAQGTGVNAQLASALAAPLIPAVNATSKSFPASRLGLRVDLFLAGTILNANPTFESGITNWTAQNNPTLASSSAQAHSGTKSMQFTPDGVTANPNALSEQVAVVPGSTYNASAWFFSTSSWPAVLVQINWYDSGHVYISTTSGVSVALSASSWKQATMGPDAVPPTNAAFAQLVLSVAGTPPSSPAFFMDDAQITTSGWVDITQYVYQRNPVQISNAGRADWTSTIQPAQLTLTLNNRDGRFTPKLASGAYYPNIVRNCQIRVFVTATSTSGVSYAGFRFYGEVSEWPPNWDPSGRDVTVSVTAGGIWRRISQFQTTLGSAFRRYVDNLANPTVQAYWPCEDGSGSGQIVPFGSPAGTQNGIQQFVAGEAGLSFASAGNWHGSDSVFTFNGATATFTVPAGGTVTANQVRFVLAVPQAGDSGQNGGTWNIAEIDTAGTVAKFEVYLLASGKLQINLSNSGGGIIASGTTTTDVRGTPYLVSCELTSGVSFALRLIQQSATGITESITGNIGSGSLGVVKKIVVNRSYQLQDTAFGQLYVDYASPRTMVGAAYALGGYVGEFALDRFKRICGEMGITTSTIGNSSSSAPMGPQIDDTLPNVLQSIEDTDCGLLYELRDQFGLGYRTNASMANQAASVILNYTSAVLDQSLTASYDDQLTRNNITISNWTGYTQQAILTAGPMSVLNPPSGIGNGYAYQRTVNAAKDTQCPGIANFLLNVGAVDEVRFPVVTIKLIKPSNAGLFSAIPNLDIGDYFQITNPPSFFSATTIKQLMWGYSETLNAKEWTFEFNTVPETPWETGFSPGTIQTAQIPGGSPVSSQAQDSLGLASLIANGSITPAMLSSGITTHTLGGNAITVSINAPPTPNLNDIWINATTGLISQWNGVAWAPVQFDASQTLIAGTIVTANIAASAITSSLIAAGTVVAGIVNATIIQAAEILSISTDTLPDYLAYKTSVANGNLVTSIAPTSGTDTVGNTYPNGIMCQQLTIVDQTGAAPPSFTGASILYTSNTGKLRYIASNGNDLVLDRCVLDGTNFTMGTQTIPHILSSTINYLAGEGLAASEYEIEISGTCTTPNSGAVPFTFDLFVDGAALSASTKQGVGSVVLQVNNTYNFCVRYRLTIDTAGSGGTCTIDMDGGCILRGANAGGNANSFTPIVNIDTALAFNTTTSHSLAIYCNWGSTVGTGHSAIVYRTRKTRRNLCL